MKKKLFSLLMTVLLILGIFSLQNSSVSAAKKTKYQPYGDPVTMRKGSYWNKSSEAKAYPNLRKIKN